MGTSGTPIFIPPGPAPLAGPMPPASSFDSMTLQDDEGPILDESSTVGGASQRTPEEVAAFIALALKRWRISADAESENRQEVLEDTRFRAGIDQWPQDVKAARDADKRPCLTINRIPQFIHQVTNDERQNRPAIQINPVGDGADVRTAEIIEGLVRSIEAKGADVAYDTAFDHAAATGGPAWIRVITEYCDDTSFDQELRIGRMLNNMVVYADPYYQEPDGSDIDYLFVVEDYTPEEFHEKWPDAKIASLPELGILGERAPEWSSEKTIRVAEYWHKERTKRVLVGLQDGTTEFEDALTEEQQAQITRRRDVTVVKVRWARISALEILEEDDNDYRGKYIPLVPVLGEEQIIDGKRRLSGIVRDAKDAQRAYNYWTSAETEMIALAPKAPYMIEVGQLEGTEKYWKKLNVQNLAYLPYKGVAIGDKLAPAPARAQWEPPVQAIAMARAQAADDLKATTGIYDASLGARGNETSGRAILARQNEGDVANFHLMDNLIRAIRQVGRILVDLIPYTYDTLRTARIIGRDQKDKLVKIQSSRNPEVGPLPLDQETATDIKRIYDVGMGKYDVTVTVGASYSTKRQAAVASIMQLVQSYPQVMQFAGDLLVRSMDWPLADKIADRILKMLPPDLQEKSDDEKAAYQIPQEVQKQITELLKQHEMLSKVAQELMDEKEKKTLELTSREKIATMQSQTAMVIKEAELKSKEGIALLQAQIVATGKRLDMMNNMLSQAGIGGGEVAPEPSMQESPESQMAQPAIQPQPQFQPGLAQ